MKPRLWEDLSILSSPLNLSAPTLCSLWHLQDFLAELQAAAGAAGLRLRKLDKKAERAWVAAHQRVLVSQAAQAADPGTLLAAAVPCLVARHQDRAVSLPGRALAAAVEKLQGDLPEEAHQLLVDFHGAVVEQLRVQSEAAAGGSDGGELDAKLQAMVPSVRDLLGSTEQRA